MEDRLSGNRRAARALHPSLSPEERRALLESGVDCFNRGEHYAAHDAWEEVWRSNEPEPRALLQGLIQTAAAFHQILGLRRRIGPRGTLAKALRNLEPFRPHALGLDLEGLTTELEDWRRWLDRVGDAPPAPSIPPPSSVPRLRVVEPAELR